MSNIKFFINNIAEYTLTSVTSEATGHEKEFLLDRRRTTYWQASDSATQEIKIDLGTGGSAGYVIVYHNPGGAFTFKVYYATLSDYSDQVLIDSSSGTQTTWSDKLVDFGQSFNASSE